MSALKAPIKLILLLTIVLLTVSYFQKNQLPSKEEVVSQLYQAPIQIETGADPFEIEREGITYDIKPLYDYELYGLVVSYHNSKSWWDYYHEEWEDFVNLKDLCVIWGDNIKTEVYKEMKFSSGSWTCHFDFKPGTSQEVWSKFKSSSGSNNHLLSASDRINKTIMKVEKGDQVYIKGYLVEYSHSEGFHRGTSTTRTDTGCETIFVQDVQILKKANPFWHSIHSIAKYLIVALLVILLIISFRSYRE